MALIGASEGVDYVTIGGSVVPSLPVKIAGGTAVVVGGNKAFHGLMKIGDAIFGNKEQVNGPSLNPLRDTVGALTKRPELYDTFEFLTEIGVASIAPITVGGVPKTFTKNSNSNSTISGKSNSQNHNWNLNGKSGDYLDKTTRKVKVTPNITETIKNSNINASKSTNWGLGNLNSKNIMDTTVGSYLNNLNSKVNNNKSYDPTPKLDYNKPLDNSLYKGVKNSEGNYTLGRGNEWSLPKTKTPYVELGNKGQGLVSVPSYNAVTNDYSRNYDVFYRTISEKHYKRLLKSGNLPPSGETSIAEDARYSERYTGINLEFKLKPGTDKQFEKIGVRNNEGEKLIKKYPNMKESFTGWEKYGYIQFKQERNQITRNLGDGQGLDIFNKNIKEINFRKEIIKNGKK